MRAAQFLRAADVQRAAIAAHHVLHGRQPDAVALHAFVAAQLKVRTLEIVMFPIGGLSRLARRLTPKEEILVTLAGPLANLAIAGAFLGYMAAVHQPVTIGLRDLLAPSDANVWQRLAFANLLAAALNLLPAFPMDGGRVLRAFMSMVRPEEEATRVAAWMGRSR